MLDRNHHKPEEYQFSSKLVSLKVHCPVSVAIKVNLPCSNSIISEPECTTAVRNIFESLSNPGIAT